MRKSTLNIVNNSHNHNYLLKKSNFISNNNGGYNLVILSMIILIMGAIMTAVIGYYDTSSINRKTKITEDKFKVIHTALVNYIMKYGKLPCPAPLDCDQNGCNGTETHPEKTLGVEFRRNSQIENECLDDGIGVFKSKNEYGEELLYGNVPAMTLGLDSNYLVDNWNNKMIYIIPELLTRDNALKNINNSSIYAGNSGEYVKDGEMFLLLSNNINTPGAYSLNNRESNVFNETVIVEVENEDGTISKVEQQVSNLPQKDFSVDLNDGHYLQYSRNLTNFFEGTVGSGTGGNEIVNPDCEAIEIDYNTADGTAGITLEYNYTGHFLAGHKMPYFIRDFAKIGTHDFIMIQPCIHHAYPNNGIWKYSLKEGLSRQFLTYPDQKDQNFEFISTYIVQTPDFVYHYDRNSDALYRINQDSLEEMYSIDLKQVLPLQARLQAMPKKQELERKAMLYDFSVSSNYVLLNYFLFEEDNPYRYVLINRENPTSPTIYYTLVNDLDDKVSSENKLYYVNDSTWCKMVDYADNDTIIQLQMLHLK